MRLWRSRRYLNAGGHEAAAARRVQDDGHLLLQRGRAARAVVTSTQRNAWSKPRAVGQTSAPCGDECIIQRRQVVVKIDAAGQRSDCSSETASGVRALAAAASHRASSSAIRSTHDVRTLSTDLLSPPGGGARKTQLRWRRAPPRKCLFTNPPRNAASALSAASVVCAEMIACTLSACCSRQRHTPQKLSSMPTAQHAMPPRMFECAPAGGPVALTTMACKIKQYGEEQRGSKTKACTGCANAWETHHSGRRAS